MKRYSVFFINALITFYCLPVSAAPAHVAQENTRSRLQKLDYTKSKIIAVDEDKIQREQWSLSKADWTRYQTLMKGIRGSISPANISPLEVLGTHARTSTERKKYAELWARMRHDDVDKILAFQKAYNTATLKLYPSEQMIDKAKLGLEQNKQVFQSGDRILVFVKTENCFECDQVIEKVMGNAMVKNMQIDIYFTDTQSEKENGKIKAWAIQHQISQEGLKQKRITLNHDKGTLYMFTKKIINEVPLVFNLKRDKLSRIEL